MPSSSIGSNSALVALLKDRHSAMNNLATAVQAGDISTAQTSLAQTQKDAQSIQSAIGASGRQSSPAYQNPAKADLTALMNAVQAGDIKSTQTAFQQLQADRQSGSTNTASAISPASTGADQQNPVLKDLGSLLSSLSSGDATGAQTAAAALQTDIQKALGGSQVSSASSSTSATSQSGGQNKFLTDLQSLITSAQSGDTAGAQKAAQSLVQDLQGAVGAAHGHHHHHAGGQSAGVENAATNTTGSAAAASSTGAAQDSDSDGDAASAATSATSALDVGGAVQNARAAYELLQNFAQSTPSHAAQATQTPAVSNGNQQS